MARKKSSYRTVKKIEPAVQTMVFEVPLTGGGTIDQLTIDLSQCASLLNRRFYRQGINWAVSGFKFLTGQYTGLIAVEKLPDTWVMSNAWEKGFRVWQRMNNEALQESESVRPRFLDFKIYADSDHHIAGFGGNLLPGVFNPAFTPATAGEWEPSKVYIPTALNASAAQTNDFELVAVGDSFAGAGFSGLDSVSLIEGYASSRGLPNVLDPNTPADADDASGSTPHNWMAALFNDGLVQTSEVVEDMQTENNIAPYPFENDGVNVDTMYPNGANQLTGLQFHDLELVTGTTVGGTSRLKGGMFPCGLIRLQAVKNEEGNSLATIIVDLVPGNHRGYLCEPMTEM
jgi:hypothetical protein